MTKIKILVIECDEGIRKLICEFLEGAGYEVVLAHSGDAGLFALRADSEIKAAIVNSYLPDMSGYEFARAVKREFPAVKLLLFTGASQEEVEDKAFEAGFSVALYKPWIGYLAQSLRELLPE